MANTSTFYVQQSGLTGLAIYCKIKAPDEVLLYTQGATTVFPGGQLFGFIWSLSIDPVSYTDNLYSIDNEIITTDTKGPISIDIDPVSPFSLLTTITKDTNIYFVAENTIDRQEFNHTMGPHSSKTLKYSIYSNSAATGTPIATIERSSTAAGGWTNETLVTYNTYNLDFDAYKSYGKIYIVVESPNFNFS
jgi:hypothetical protein